MTYDTVIGLEVHIQMNTASKAFCPDGNVFGDEANTHVSAISAAHPGTLPVPNMLHIEKAIRLGLALGCKINQTSFFDRKHYFYPDLPKGYQITQDHRPICVGGHLNIRLNNGTKKIRIHHIHMEEDAGKTIHDIHPEYSLIDLNRAGTPLLELVTEPDLSNGDEVFEFIAELQKLLRFIEVSDADMEKGSMRCDCNVSVKPAGRIELGERCEIKNLNSKRFAREAVRFESARQIEMIEDGQTFSKQTLHFDPITGSTKIMRKKEGIADYRYFPDPDLPPIQISDETLRGIQDHMPELPWKIKRRLTQELGLSRDYAEQITQSVDIYDYFKDLVSLGSDARPCANLLVNQVLPSLTEGQSISEFALSLDQCTSYLQLIDQGKLSASQAHQQLWPALLNNPQKSPEDLAEKMGLIIQTKGDELVQLVQEIIASNPRQANEYQKGKKALIGFFIGAVKRSSKEAINPKELKTILEEQLSG